MMKRMSLSALIASIVLIGSTLPATATPDTARDALETRYSNSATFQKALTVEEKLIESFSRAWDAELDAIAAEEAALSASSLKDEVLQDYRTATEVYNIEKGHANKQAELALQREREKQSAPGRGYIPPTLAALFSKPESFDDYLQTRHQYQQVYERADYAANEANKGYQSAEDARVVMQQEKDAVDPTVVERAEESAVVAEELREESDKLKEKSQKELNKVLEESETLGAELAKTDVGKKVTASGPDLVMAEAARVWWENNSDKETSKARGESNVEVHEELIEEEATQRVPSVDEETGEGSLENEEQERVKEHPENSDNKALDTAENVKENTKEPTNTKQITTSEETTTPDTNNATTVDKDLREDKKDKKTPDDKNTQKYNKIADKAVKNLGNEITKPAQCRDFIRNTYDLNKKYSLATIASENQQYNPTEAIPGDLILYTGADNKISRVGVYMGAGLSIVPSLSQKAFILVPAKEAVSAVRVGEPVTDKDVQQKYDESEKWECGSIKTSAPKPSDGFSWKNTFDHFKIQNAYHNGNLSFKTKTNNTNIHTPLPGVVTKSKNGTIVIETSRMTLTYSNMKKDHLLVNVGAILNSGDVIATNDTFTLNVKMKGKNFNPTPLVHGTWKNSLTHNHPDNMFGRSPFPVVPESVNQAVHPTNGRLSSNYGPRPAPVPGAEPFHRGTDFASPAGTPIRSVADGVVWATFSDSGSGNQIIVQHNVNGKNYAAVYKHMSSNPDEYAQVGDIVKAGTIIGRVGSTGIFSTGPHLHFEIWETTFNRNHHVNSLTWLRNLGV